MTEFRFIHTSDLHLGRRFGQLPEEPRGVLAAARRDVIRALAGSAQAHGAGHVLVAGDLFDTETPSDQVVRQALNAMGEVPGICWWVIPGNHDSLAAEALWERFRRDAPANVRLLDKPEPIEIRPGVVLLPAPAAWRYAGRDLTEWMSTAETGKGALRIGLAHGAVQTFSSEDGGAEVIPPDRAETARLDYLALGDWHGRLSVGPRTHYSGTPERDRFKHPGAGLCLAVRIAGPGAVPIVEEIRTGRFNWLDIELPMTPEREPEDAVRRALAEVESGRENVLVRLRASGWVTLRQRLALSRAVAAAAPDFCHFDYDETELATEYETGDLDDIDIGGALRLAADTLLEEAWDKALAEEQRRVAGAALTRLYSIVKGSVA
ncbi:metallophosphoesterase family protein [Palleronia sp. KMU-117]|uniref:metallophosphoesterase family protein n=1 Tax=Palleronia sp. KMU-117 TaxID=3434108 RepID=UPI003D70C244